MVCLLPEQLSALRAFDSATVANAVERLAVRDPRDGFASLELRCMFPDMAPMVGYAVTCTVSAFTPGAPYPLRHVALYEAVARAPKPVIVVMQDVSDNRLKGGHVGDMLSTILWRLGAIGAVTDSGVRDLAAVRRRTPGFQIFGAGTVVAHGIPAIIDVGATVSICGLQIRPGDLLHGDVNGLQTIPDGIADRIAAEAEAVARHEDEVAAFVNSAEFSLEGLCRLYGV
jgi:4-hydroxy-4-methyl-2-oxoglutarate aldolase